MFFSSNYLVLVFSNIFQYFILSIYVWLSFRISLGAIFPVLEVDVIEILGWKLES